jgi:hypothetical protein
MDRLTRISAGLGLGLILLATGSGCHNVRDEVPPHHTFRNDGKSRPGGGASPAADNTVEFSTKPHDPNVTASGLIGAAPSNMAPGRMAPPSSPLNSSASAGNAYTNLNSESKFGGPGTSGLGGPPPLTGSDAAATYPPTPPSRKLIVPDSGAGNPN